MSKSLKFEDVQLNHLKPVLGEIWVVLVDSIDDPQRRTYALDRVRGKLRWQEYFLIKEEKLHEPA